MKLKVIDIAHHRNGICGSPFDVVLFQDHGDEASRKVGIVFESTSHVAVLDVGKLAEGDIAFASNSWRGDKYEPHLRKALALRQRAIEAEMTDDDILDDLHHEATNERNQTMTPNHDIDIDALLADRKQIALIWSIEDVQEVRPDLTDKQAWEVLQQVKSHHDATLGVTWETLEWVAQDLFGDAPETGHA
jgi:hypothetical protein